MSFKGYYDAHIWLRIIYIAIDLANIFLFDSHDTY